MRKFIVLVTLSLSILNNIQALDIGDTYYYAEKWGNGNEMFGEIRVQLIVVDIADDMIEISIQKDMLPFLQVIYFTTKSKYEEDKYMFKCFDNWQNTVFGYFSMQDDKIILFLDCEQFSDEGKNIARLYGDTVVLQRKAYSQL